jgi:hypothetical protein
MNICAAGIILLQNAADVHLHLKSFSPLLVEGPGQVDDRDAAPVANKIVKNLQNYWGENMTKPVLLITQGDPLNDSGKGIASITRLVAEGLGVKRGLVLLDPHIDQDHEKYADRHDVSHEMRYSTMLEIIREHHEHDAVGDITKEIDRSLSEKNEKRRELGQQELAAYYKDYALLQEVTKVAIKAVAGEVTVAHTTGDISEFGVTSFFQVGLNLGLIDETEIVSFE